MRPQVAVDQIEYWEEQLGDVETSGVKGVLTDLHALKSKLQAEEIDGEAVVDLLGALGDKSNKIAGRVDDEKAAEQLRGVGEGLEAAA